MIDEAARARLQTLVRIAERELRHLRTTDARLFATPLTIERLAGLENEPDLAERIDAFVSRLSRLQDTLGDKLLPRYLRALGEAPGAFIDNLSRAERLGLVGDAEHWLELRKLRNRMVHEYLENPAQLAQALEHAHRAVHELAATCEAMATDMRRRGWIQ